MFSTILLFVFVPVCLLLILIVLLQAGKGGGLAGAFGGAGGQTFLGARGAADFLSKFTIYLAIAFMFLSLILSLTYGRGGRSIRIDEEPASVETSAETPAEERAAAETEQPQSPAADEGSEAPSPEGGE